ncbi:MAG: hypothetical protein M1838_000939 [Thelocarpon superellum]|nr:MAG: hypothetical protein M1838_000939 [Thelocarpon superellum]
MFTELCGGLGDEQQSEVLSLLAGGDFGRASEDDQLMLVRKIIPSIKGPSEHFSQPREVLSKLISHLCQQLVECRSIRRFRVVADCVEALLLKQPWAVSQFNVESVLSSVVGIGCATGPNISPDHGGVMFQRLCRLLGALLAVHRLKLKGRSHLVVQVMQAMLRLLFVPNRGVLQQRAGPASARPPWLRGKGAGLGVAEGVAYTRVLSSLCDPTVSAVANKSQRSKQPLTPATDRARRGMGQHLPYLLMEYAQCQLHSRLLPDVKNTLRPGLYAIFDIADQATLRMVNASMDASSRAIFKTLADDYRRFGRWDQG